MDIDIAIATIVAQSVHRPSNTATPLVSCIVGDAVVQAMPNIPSRPALAQPKATWTMVSSSLPI